MQISLFLHQIWINVALHHLFPTGSSEVNGCRQNNQTADKKISQVLYIDYSPSITILWSEKAVCLYETNPSSRHFVIQTIASALSESGEKYAQIKRGLEVKTVWNISKQICWCQLWKHTILHFTRH